MTKEKLTYIICVDDEKIVLDSLQSQLTRNLGDEYNYEFAQSGEEALEVIDEIIEDSNDIIYVVISDWLMPGMKGDELLKVVKEKLNNVKVILLTGHVDSAVIRRIQENNKDNIKCIYKPWDERQLMQFIRE